MRESLLPCQPAILWMIGAQFLLDLIAFPVFEAAGPRGTAADAAAIFFWGGVVGQVALLAAYQAWGRELWIRRLGKSIFLAVLIWAAFTLGEFLTGPSFVENLFSELMAMLIGGTFLFLSMLFWGTRFVVGLRFERADDDAGLSLGAGQFHVRDLLVWTVGAAIVFGILQTQIGRDVIIDRVANNGPELGWIALWTSIASLLCALVAIPATWVALAKHRTGPALAGVAAYAFVLGVIEWIILSILIRDAGAAFLMLSCPNLGVAVQVLTVSLLLRAFGYRLAMRGK